MPHLNKTQAAVLVETNRPLELIELELPGLKPGQVLVEVSHAGICRSQLHEIRGRRGPDRYLPHTLGHEGSGRVIQTGPGVKKVKPNDTVVLSWIKGRGAEVSSTSYRSPLGKINSGAISTFMNQTLVSENRLFPIPSKLPLREAALLGCAFPTGAGIVYNTLQIPPGSTVAIFGAGGIGLSAILAAAGIEKVIVIAVDIYDAKLDHAKRLGARHLIHAKKQDPVATIFDITEKKGADYAIECAGCRESMEAAFECVRDQGGTCVLAGNLAHGEKISLDPFHLIKGKRIVGTWGGETVPDRDIPRYADLQLSGKLKLEDLISHEFSLVQINEAFQELENGSLARAVIKL